VVKLMIAKDLRVKGSKILMLGITFKENCPDIRNTRAVDIISELRHYNAEVQIFDPWANPAELRAEYGLDCIESPVETGYDAIILAVAHKVFLELNIRSLCSTNKSVVYDVKGVLGTSDIDGRL